MGALAVALGVGAAISTGHGLGVARADTDSDSVSKDSPSADSSSDAPSESSDETESTTDSSSEQSDSEDEDESASELTDSTSEVAVGDSEDDVDLATDDTEEDPALLGEVAPDDTAPSTIPPETGPLDSADGPGAGEIPALPQELPTAAPEAESRSDAADSTVTTQEEPAPPPSAPAEVSIDAATLSLSDETDTEASVQFTDGASEATIGGQSTLDADPAASVAAGSVAGINVPKAFAATSLSPLLVPSPLNPYRPQLLFAVIGWVIREVQRTFFNRTPVVRPQETTLVLSPDETSTPISFDSYDFDGDRLTYFVPARGVPGGPTHGWVDVDQATGTFTYTRDENYTGPDQFTVTVSDAGNGCHFHGLFGFLRSDWGHTDKATIKLHVAANQPPVVNSDSFTALQDGFVFGNVLDNDSDPDGQTLTASVVSGPTNGDLTMSPDGAFHYSPKPGWNGIDTFVYSASDSMLAGHAVVGVTVTPVNRAPATGDDSYTTAEDTTVIGNVLTNDTDADGDAITATVVVSANHGDVQLSPDGSFTYTPDADFNGTDTFSYVASDGSLSSAPTVVTITVTPVNDGPVAQDDNFTISEDSRLNGNVLSNDTDRDRDPLTVSLASGPAHGSLTLNADGTFSYVPTTNYNGTDSFTYTVSDGTATSNTATATITISPVNDAPVANNGSFSVSEDSSYTGAVNVLDVDGDTVTTDVVTSPAHGTLTLNDDGSFTYTPDAHYTGVDSFTYTGTDGVRTTSPATVTITVAPINDAPTAQDDTYAMSEDGILTGGVLYNDSDADGDTLTATLVFAPMHGALTFNADGSFTYTPHADYAGADSFAYTASDGTLTSSTAIVSITIAPANDAPVAADDFYNIDEDTVLTGNLLSNDLDVDGDSLAVSLIDGPQNGVLDLNSDGTFSYTPAANFNGVDWFTYSASDGTTLSAPALVLIIINPVDDTLVANNDTYTVTEDSSLTGNVLSNDVDIDGDPLSATLVDGPAHGELTLNSDGTFAYTPDADYTGTDSFTYTATDGVVTSAAGTVSITITAVNDTPTAVSDSLATDEDTPLSGNVLSNDVDVDGDSLTATLVTGPAHGDLTLNTDGTFTYTPDADYTGADSFTYAASDGAATSTTASVAITVTAVNDTPVSQDDTFTTDEDTTLAGNVLSNDTDIDGDSLTASLVDGPAHGELVLNADGTFTYTPDSDYHGTDSFTYTATDGTATSTVSIVAITVNAVNDTPVSQGDSFTTNEDTTLAGNVLSNDTDIDGDSLTATLVDGPTHGELVLNADGTFTYTPDADYTGADSFTYTATDGTATSAVSTVAITVNAVNDTPVSQDDSFTTNEDTTLAGNVLTNDTDIDGDTLTATLIDGPTHGDLVLNADGTFTYTPDADYTGTDSFTYTATDGTATSTVSTVAITVNAVNDTPVSQDDSFTTNEDTELSGNVLTNDTDIDGDTLTATLIDGPTHGNLVLNADGTFTYTPDADYTGTDSFTYTATDGTATSTVSTVAITVNAVNDTPVSQDDTFTTDEDTELSGNVLSNDSDIDGDTLTASLVDGPTHGELVLNADGTFTYTPDTDYSGTDSFTYTATDGTATSTTATVSITVAAVNDTPVSQADTFTTDEDTELTGNVLTNDTDIDGDTLTATLVDGPAHGDLVLNANGTFTYTPDADYTGSDSFTYTATDGTATSTASTVIITVNPVNDVPVVANDSFTTDEDTQLSGNVLSNDTDIDGDSLTASLVDGPAHGDLVLNANGTFTYTPDADYTGADSFTYTATDGTATSTTATVSITVAAVNDTPVSQGDSFTTDEDTQLAGNVLTNDTDIDGDSLTASLVTGPAHGELVLNADGTFTYTPDADYTGADSFTYTATDGAATSTTASVAITVTAVNDTPVSQGDTFTTDEDTQLAGNVLSNDTDIDGDSLTASLVDGPTHGELVLNADGTFTYTPDADYQGTDSFTYTATDGTATSAVSTISITVAAVNDTPVSQDDTFTTDEDTELSGNVLSNDTDIDGDSLTASLVDGPAHGDLVLNADGTFTYTPDADYTGTDSFTYTATDGTATSTVSTVSITVAAVNDTPVSQDDTFTTDEDTELSGSVLSNDSDIDGDSLTASLVDGPTHGDLVLNTDGTFTYTPDADYTGADSFTYTATDGTATSTVSTVSITVNPINDTPVSQDDSFTTDEDTTLAGNVLTNDTDIDGDTLTASLVDGPAHGELVLNADGTFTYTPDADYQGTDSFTYTATDGTATSAVSTISITVAAVNDTPVSQADTFTTDEDTELSGNVLSNDTDIDGDSLTASLVDGPTHGELVLNADGTFTYTPDTDYTGTDSFAYTATDGTATSAVSTVSITVNPVNDTPVVANDTFTTDEDTELSGNVLTNDADVDGDSLTSSLVDGPAHGELVLNADGTFTYTPDTDYSGTDSFTYTATDGTATSAVSTVSITVNPVNDTPVSQGDSFTTDEDTELSGNVLTNDTDIDGDTLTASLVTGPAHGELVLNADGTFTYTPDADYHGTDSFTYTATDGTATTATTAVAITVNPVNDAPGAQDDSYTIDEDYILSASVLDNDVDAEGNSLTVSLVDGPANGTLTLNNDGTFTYTPDADYNGTDSFTYTATDGTAISDVATVTITVNPVNDATVANNDSFSTGEDSSLLGNVLTNDFDVDGDTFTATLLSGPSHGTLVLNPDGSFSYTPTADYSGIDTFSYQVSDGTATSNTALVTIAVTAVNDSPVAVNDSFTTGEDAELAGNVLANDTDVEGDSLSATLVTGPTHGSLTLNSDGTFTYTPDADYTGTDSFTYTAGDAALTDSAVVTISITSVNDAPVATGDSFTTDEDTQLTGNVLTNDSDVDADTLTASLVTGPSHGTLSLNADGTFTYTPTANYNGTDSFTYTATDGTATSNVATVSITVNAVNDTPVATNDNFTTNEDTQLTGNVLTNDPDAESTTLTATLVTGPSHGTLSLNADGTFTYTPTTNYNGTDSFTYTATDGTATSNIATVSITVNAVNDAPVAVNNNYTTSEDVQLTGNVLTNDIDADGNTLTATLVTGPTRGTLTLNSDGSFTYTPTTNYHGTDVFTYRANDGIANSSTAIVVITVTSVNDVPAAVNDAYTTNEESTLNGNVLANDTDADGNTLTATLVNGPSHGTLNLNSDGTFTYTPTTNYNGTDSFTYTATDGSATSNVATVAITVNPVNDTPTAVNDAFSTNEDVQLAGNVLTNDIDVDGNTLTATLVAGPTHGSLTLNSNGTFTYTPTTNYNGTDSFTYTASDGTATSNVATVVVTVNAVNDAPTAVNDSASTNQGVALNGDVLSNDTDIDGNTLSATLVAGPTHGSLTLNSNGSFTYTPAANFNGTDSFTYTATDGTAASNTATVSITVIDNVAPTAVDIQATDGGGLNISGFLEQGDTITYTFSEPIDPTSILAGWNGTTTNVVVRGDNGGSSNDTLRIYNSANTALLPLGTIDLGRTDFIFQFGGNGPITFGASGTPSTMTMNGNTITIVLGNYDSPAFGDYRNITLALTSGTLRWVPSTTIYDLAGNTLSSGTATEGGSSDRDF